MGADMSDLLRCVEQPPRRHAQPIHVIIGYRLTDAHTVGRDLDNEDLMDERPQYVYGIPRSPLTASRVDGRISWRE
jgi:hypothetical protein